MDATLVLCDRMAMPCGTVLEVTYVACVIADGLVVVLEAVHDVEMSSSIAMSCDALMSVVTVTDPVDGSVAVDDLAEVDVPVASKDV